ncbi:MAG: DUF420 domain-containing protein [Gemmataceae bacterium]|nr:DUF420 domain-containing protein [Gemmataceae bacterium]
MEFLNQIITPGWNATLNGMAGILVLAGFFAIKSGKKVLHGRIMLTAVAVSAAFLASYLYYHFLIQRSVATSFASRNPTAPAGVKWAYYSILISHVILAILITPVVVFTAWQGWKGNLARHVKLARWTLPIWLYVSVTGVVVYWMLYRMYA